MYDILSETGYFEPYNGGCVWRRLLVFFGIDTDRPDPLEICLLRAVRQHIIRGRAAGACVLCGTGFFASTFLNIRGWKVIPKTFAVSWLAFQIYWLMTLWSGIHYQECTALNYPRGLFPIFGGIAMQIEATVWSLICAAIFLVYNQCRKVVVPNEADDFLKIK